MNPISVIVAILSGACGFGSGYIFATVFRPREPIVLERTAEGETRIVQVDGQTKWKPHTGPPLRPYVVREDGATEYSDGEVVFPDATIIRPPDMRIIE